MNRTQLADLVSRQLDVNVDDVDEIVVATMNTIADCLSRGESVNLRSFGVFEPHRRRETELIHPGSRQRLRVPERISVRFRPSETLKRRLNPGWQPRRPR